MMVVTAAPPESGAGSTRAPRRPQVPDGNLVESPRTRDGTNTRVPGRPGSPATGGAPR